MDSTFRSKIKNGWGLDPDEQTVSYLEHAEHIFGRFGVNRIDPAFRPLLYLMAELANGEWKPDQPMTEVVDELAPFHSSIDRRSKQWRDRNKNAVVTAGA